MLLFVQFKITEAKIIYFFNNLNIIRLCIKNLIVLFLIIFVCVHCVHSVLCFNMALVQKIFL